MNSWELIILFFSFQAFLLAVLFLLKKQGIRYANRVMAVMLFLFSYNLFFNVLYWSRFSEEWFALVRFTYTIPLSLYGALLFLYIRNVTVGTKIGLPDALHFIPFALVLYQFGGFYILPLETKMEFVALETDVANTRYMSWVYPFIVLCMMGYCLYTYFRFVRYYVKDPELRIWLQAIILVFFLYSLSHVIYALFSHLIEVSNLLDYIMTLFMTSLVGLVSYFAFMQPAVFNGKPIQEVIPLVKYERTGLSEAFSLELKERLVRLMEQEKPHLNAEIRLDGIAEMLDISRHHASQIINQHFSVHFYDFINEYRVKEAEQLLRDQKASLSISDIAFQSGFNNRISFYKAFKKVMGITPSEYREHSMAS